MKADDKKELRKRMLALRRALTRQEVKARSDRVLSRLLAGGLLSGPKTAALYAAADGEVLTRPLHDRLRERGALVVLPRVRGAGPEIDFYPAGDWDRLELSPLGIPEPRPDGEPVDPAAFDLVITPGVAFDRSGARLGYGMGCYDRTLQRTRPETPRVGIAYDFQVVERLPVEPHDVPLTHIVTESVIIHPSTG